MLFVSLFLYEQCLMRWDCFVCMCYVVRVVCFWCGPFVLVVPFVLIVRCVFFVRLRCSFCLFCLYILFH